MNWTCLVYGGPMLIVVVYWFVDAHKWFKGPKVFLATTEMLRYLEQPLMFTRRSTSSTRCLADQEMWSKEKEMTAETRAQAVSQRRTGNFKTRRRQILLERRVFCYLFHWLYMIPRFEICRVRICSTIMQEISYTYTSVCLKLRSACHLSLP